MFRCVVLDREGQQASRKWQNECGLKQSEDADRRRGWRDGQGSRRGGRVWGGRDRAAGMDWGGAAECPGVRNGRQRGCAQDGGGVRLDHQQEEGRRRSGQTAP